MEEYSITVLQEIAEEPVALASADVKSYFSVPFYIGMCVLMLLLIYLVHYVVKCYMYQRRATKMQGKKKRFLFDIRSGKRSAYEAEVQKAEQIWKKLN